VSALVDWLVRPLLAGEQHFPPEVRLGPQEFRLAGMEVTARASWEELLTPAPRFRELHLCLLSPTGQHAGRPFRKRLVLPDPALYFGGWLQRWNLCCERPLSPALLEVVREQVEVTACRGETQTLRLDAHAPFVGFVGQVSFELLQPESVAPEARTALAALARFSGYCGTGGDTMRGMGQTVAEVR
jgi:CRISPR/Cas system endoribonuclease Cas6 (RAMP superfamily)